MSEPGASDVHVPAVEWKRGKKKKRKKRIMSDVSLVEKSQAARSALTEVSKANPSGINQFTKGGAGKPKVKKKRLSQEQKDKYADLLDPKRGRKVQAQRNRRDKNMIDWRKH